MKALVYAGPRKITYTDMPDPIIEEDRDVIVQVSACSICGSDLHIYAGESFTGESGGFCVGHEAVGEVVAVGSGVRHRKVGDRVMLPAAVGCGECRKCLAGDVLQCLNFRQQCYGLGSALQGCQAQLVRVPVGDLNSSIIPDGLSDEQALMLTDSMATAWYGCRNAAIRPGADVAIVGLGPIGLMAIEGAFAMGAARVFAIDPVKERRAWAQSLGAIALEPLTAAEVIRDATAGQMLDCVVEAAGTTPALTNALKLAGREKNVSVIGVNLSPNFPFPLGEVLLRGVNLAIGTCSVPRYWPELIPLVREGRLNPHRFITHRAPLAEGAAIYTAFAERQEGILKAVLRP
ncbi:alcohol dehydrogenase [Pseudomonas sp. BN414]|uniref:alcohol dehydrogenase catalytic domain-containing protein n=1 Tax=unclassified Pseudomonas TaxID=196821 RepID=UPI0024550A9C|nr:MULTISPECIES: alcohol dehydrogenase catalytic domain-containing protein [unclassified Pseudomonas]MDH4561228.1 alcohol dehydrogenase [Pseudomonas sp. BN411]MDH4565453.1 alcohol dehydrogenase [Pseudomonas sp. BN414]MDH4656956.1 alcohol dehydrogenase [Pseudomonas sp. BN606]MDH4874471.1 alcohol dehydrogenase [Pseudomonas sp. BN515]